MTYTIEVVDCDIVKVTHKGALNLELVKTSRREAAALMAEKGISLLLADISEATIEDSIASLFEFNSTHHVVLPPGVKIAVLVSEMTASEEKIRFAETVSVNRGVLMKAFGESPEAERWLRG